jgi:hypothetical protein
LSQSSVCTRTWLACRQKAKKCNRPCRAVHIHARRTARLTLTAHRTRFTNRAHDVARVATRTGRTT